LKEALVLATKKQKINLHFDKWGKKKQPDPVKVLGEVLIDLTD